MRRRISLFRRRISLFRRGISQMRRRISLFPRGISQMRRHISLFRRRISQMCRGISLLRRGILLSHDEVLPGSDLVHPQHGKRATQAGTCEIPTRQAGLETNVQKNCKVFYVSGVPIGLGQRRRFAEPFGASLSLRSGSWTSSPSPRPASGRMPSRRFSSRVFSLLFGPSVFAPYCGLWVV